MSYYLIFFFFSVERAAGESEGVGEFLFGFSGVVADVGVDLFSAGGCVRVFSVGGSAVEDEEAEAGGEVEEREDFCCGGGDVRHGVGDNA